MTFRFLAFYLAAESDLPSSTEPKNFGLTPDDLLCVARRHGQSWWFCWSHSSYYWYARKSHQSFWPVADLIASIVPPGFF